MHIEEALDLVGPFSSEADQIAKLMVSLETEPGLTMSATSTVKSGVATGDSWWVL